MSKITQMANFFWSKRIDKNQSVDQYHAQGTMKPSFDEMMRGQASNVDQIVIDTVERQCLCVVFFVFRRIHDAELGRMTRFGRFGCQMYQPPHRRSDRENRNSSDRTALKSREL
jgi:hypothetical protein